METYVYHCGATRITAEPLMKALNATGGTDKPEKPVDLVIGWGAKTSKDLKMKTKHSVNHPNCIRGNRNKYNALKIMAAAKVNVADFWDHTEIMAELKKKKSSAALPLIGRTYYHQGGNGFWTCMTEKQVQKAINGGAQYFQNYIPIDSEYRLHVFKGEVFYAHKKVEHKNPKEAFVSGYLEKVKSSTKAKEGNFDEDTAKMVLNNMAERRNNSNPVLRSHGEGWQFNTVKKEEMSSKVVKSLCDLATKAVAALDLSFGAVDCAVSEDGQVYVLEVNTAPGVTGKTFDAWVDVFKSYIDSLEKAKSTPPTTSKKTEEKKTEAKASATVAGSSLRDKSIAQIDAIKELLMNAENDVETKTIMKVASRSLDSEAQAGAKLFGG